MAVAVHIVKAAGAEDPDLAIPSGKDVNSAANELFTKESCVGDTVATSDSELLDASRKVDDVDSPWAELGLIPKITTLKKDEMEVGPSSRMDYELLSGDEFSNMDEESLSVSSSTKRESAKPREKEGSSSLQILDSWYSQKAESSGNKPEQPAWWRPWWCSSISAGYWRRVPERRSPARMASGGACMRSGLPIAGGEDAMPEWRSARRRRSSARAGDLVLP